LNDTFCELPRHDAALGGHAHVAVEEQRIALDRVAAVDDAALRAHDIAVWPELEPHADTIIVAGPAEPEAVK
jgi:hypothetical protein